MVDVIVRYAPPSDEPTFLFFVFITNSSTKLRHSPVEVAVICARTGYVDSGLRVIDGVCDDVGVALWVMPYEFVADCVVVDVGVCDGDSVADEDAVDVGEAVALAVAEPEFEDDAVMVRDAVRDAVRDDVELELPVLLRDGVFVDVTVGCNEYAQRQRWIVCTRTNRVQESKRGIYVVVIATTHCLRWRRRTRSRARWRPGATARGRVCGRRRRGTRP